MAERASGRALRIGPQGIWLVAAEAAGDGNGARADGTGAGGRVDERADGYGDGYIGGRAAALLAHLALVGPLPRLRAAALLWPDAAPARARANLRQLLHRLGPVRELLAAARDPLAFAAPPPIVALEAPLPGSGDDGELAALLEAGAERWRRRRAEDLLVALRAAEDRRDGAAAVVLARRLAAVAPDDDARLRTAVAILARLGERSAALALARDLRRRLTDLLGAAAAAQLGIEAALAESGDDPFGWTGLELLRLRAPELERPEGAAALRALDDAFPQWRDAWLRAAAAPDPELLAEASAPLARWAERSGRLHEGVALLAQGEALLDRARPRARAAAARLRIHGAWLKHLAGVPGAAEDARLGLELLGPETDAGALRAEAHHALGVVAWSRGDPAAARTSWERARAAAEGAGGSDADPYRAMRLHGNLAMAADALGDRGRARRHYRRALALAERLAAPEAQVAYLTNLGQVELELGALGAARDLLERALERTGDYDLAAHAAYPLDALALLALREGDVATAAERLELAFERARGRADRHLWSDLLRSRARIALARGEAAVGAALAALRAARAARQRPATDAACRLLAEALDAAGAADEATAIRTATSAGGARLEALIERLLADP